jgi:hypothetical protein
MHPKTLLNHKSNVRRVADWLARADGIPKRGAPLARISHISNRSDDRKGRILGEDMVLRGATSAIEVLKFTFS